LDLRGGDVLQPVAVLLVAGVQHEDVEPAQLAHGARDELRALILAAHVARHPDRDAARLFDPVRGLLRVVLLLGEVGDGHIGALPRVGDRDRAPDARVASRDEGAHPREAPGAAVALLPVIGCGVGARGETRLRLLLLGKALGAVARDGVRECVAHAPSPRRAVAAIKGVPPRGSACYSSGAPAARAASSTRRASAMSASRCRASAGTRVTSQTGSSLLSPGSMPRACWRSRTTSAPSSAPATRARLLR